MADPMFLRGGKLSAGLDHTRNLEQRIITETIRSTRGTEEVAFHCVSGGENDFSTRIGKCEHTDEASAALVVGDRLHLLEKQRVVVGVALAAVVKLSPPRARHAWFASERVNLKPAVVRERPGVELPGVSGCLQAGIGTKRRAGFFNWRGVWMRREIGPLKAIVAEHIAEFTHFSGIPGGDEDLHVHSPSDRSLLPMLCC